MLTHFPSFSVISKKKNKVESYISSVIDRDGILKESRIAQMKSVVTNKRNRLRSNNWCIGVKKPLVKVYVWYRIIYGR